MSGYEDFSTFYDRLMTGVDYPVLAGYLLSLFERHGSRPQTLLDIACGSGSLCKALLDRGIDAIGIDASGSMLARAVEKLAGYPSVLLLQQDMRELDLYGTADGAVCSLDSLNHLCSTAEVERFFRRLRLFVEPGGLFVFDVNTPYKHREILADNAFVFEQSDFLCVWRNRYFPKTGEVSMLLDFFTESPDGSYGRVSDTVRERAYSERTLRRLLKDTGWDCLAVYGEMSYEAPCANCERTVWVARNNRTRLEALGKDD